MIFNFCQMFFVGTDPMPIRILQNYYEMLKNPLFIETKSFGWYEYSRRWVVHRTQSMAREMYVLVPVRNCSVSVNAKHVQHIIRWNNTKGRYYYFVTGRTILEWPVGWSVYRSRHDIKQIVRCASIIEVERGTLLKSGTFNIRQTIDVQA